MVFVCMYMPGTVGSMVQVATIARAAVVRSPRIISCHISLRVVTQSWLLVLENSRSRTGSTTLRFALACPHESFSFMILWYSYFSMYGSRAEDILRYNIVLLLYCRCY